VTKRNRTTWRLTDDNYDWVQAQMASLGLTSMNDAINLLIATMRGAIIIRKPALRKATDSTLTALPSVKAE
jgi:hypothetical protein